MSAAAGTGKQCKQCGRNTPYTDWTLCEACKGDARAELRCELRIGRWEDALADVGMVDALICDPPYSERTHAAYRDMPEMRRSAIAYTSMSALDVAAFVAAWAPRVRGWMVVLTDHGLAPTWEKEFDSAGRYVFAPIACMEPGSRVRLTGDGPTQWSVWAVCSRPKTSAYARWGALPGGYVTPYREARVNASNRGERVKLTGGKPEWLMRALVRDYTRPGDLIVDPCAGGGTTLIAARAEGRHSIGAEMDPATHALASKRIGRPWTPNLFGDYAP